MLQEIRERTTDPVVLKLVDEAHDYAKRMSNRLVEYKMANEEEPIPPGDYVIIQEKVEGAFVRCKIAIGPYTGRQIFIPRSMIARIETETVYVNGQVAYPQR